MGLGECQALDSGSAAWIFVGGSTSAGCVSWFKNFGRSGPCPMMAVFMLLAGFLGGACNARAGGGTFLIFLALLLAGIAPVEANATASLIVLPGVFASAWVYRDALWF